MLKYTSLAYSSTATSNEAESPLVVEFWANTTELRMQVAMSVFAIIGVQVFNIIKRHDVATIY